MNAFKPIEHIVVLMMENRSFDNMLGWQFGLDPSSSNVGNDGQTYTVWPQAGKPVGSDMTIPDPDPGELFTDMNQQIFGLSDPPSDAEPTMGGFVENYQGQKKDPVACDIMHCYRPRQLPATSALAAAFGHSDRWHASAPCQTWPNRFFAACATADGWVNNLPDPAWKVVERLPFSMDTIYNQFREPLLGFDDGWRIYFHDIALNFLLSKLWRHLDHFHWYDRFREDVQNGDLQPYSFIEPRYFPDPLLGHMPNDSHPPYDVTLGEALIADVYNTLRCKEELWKKTLLIVTYDEHGGCYDSYSGNLQPGSAVSPDGRDQDGFTFNRFGVRVPTIFASPYVAKGSVHRAPAGGYPFDHTSIIKSVKECFGLRFDSLTQRDLNAPSVASVLDPDLDNLGPESIEVPVPAVPEETLQAAANAPLTDYQKGLTVAMAHLPDHDRIDSFLEGDRPAPSPDYPPTAGEAVAQIKPKVRRFLGRER